jgi:hypothetical protein
LAATASVTTEQGSIVAAPDAPVELLPPVVDADELPPVAVVVVTAVLLPELQAEATTASSASAPTPTVSIPRLRVRRAEGC